MTEKQRLWTNETKWNDNWSSGTMQKTIFNASLACRSFFLCFGFVFAVCLCKSYVVFIFFFCFTSDSVVRVTVSTTHTYTDPCAYITTQCGCSWAWDVISLNWQPVSSEYEGKISCSLVVFPRTKIVQTIDLLLTSNSNKTSNKPLGEERCR